MSVQTEKFTRFCTFCVSGAFIVMAVITTAVMLWVMML